mmetsp:Transcript_170680/g.547486  ORF Transcript_170680/g.547486 Transcript_170680/m.547486 type:complete len:122 (+) Transcript_170680:2759-3124(+)
MFVAALCGKSWIRNSFAAQNQVVTWCAQPKVPLRPLPMRRWARAKAVFQGLCKQRCARKKPVSQRACGQRQDHSRMILQCVVQWAGHRLQAAMYFARTSWSSGSECESVFGWQLNNACWGK